MQVTDILARLAICEKASIDECYLDITAEARKRAEDQQQLNSPVNAHQVHISGEVKIEQNTTLPFSLKTHTLCGSFSGLLFPLKRINV